MERGVQVMAAAAARETDVVVAPSSRPPLWLFHLQYALRRRFGLADAETPNTALLISQSEPAHRYTCVGALTDGSFLYRTRASSWAPVIRTPVPFYDVPLCETDGWQPTEPWGRWTAGNSARWTILVPSGMTDPVLQMDVAGLTGGEIAHQRIILQIDGDDTVQWLLDGDRIVKTIPLSSGPATLHFMLPDATSPAKLDIADDARVLGMSITRICLTERQVACL